MPRPFSKRYNGQFYRNHGTAVEFRIGRVIFAPGIALDLL